MRFGVCNKPAALLYEAMDGGEGQEPVADELLYGWPCRIIAEKGHYQEIMTEYGYRGYVRREDITVLPTGPGDGLGETFPAGNFSAESPLSGESIIEEEGTIAEKGLQDYSGDKNYLTAKKYYVNRNLADALSTPKVQGKILITLYRGSYVRAEEGLADADGWAAVRLNHGTVGYMPQIFLSEWNWDGYGDYFTGADDGGFTGTKREGVRGSIAGMERDRLSSVRVLRQAIVRSAMGYLGVQYRWGGKTPLGIDCSGLAFMSYFENGVFIFRDSRIEAGYPVKKIPSHMMDKGDLLYFPGHVAVYLGEGKYIHATAQQDSFGVVVNSLYPWEPDFRADLCEKLEAVGSIF